MSTYIMTDIHGCFDLFMKMLEIISFSSDDLLVLAGDYIDRGSQNYELLEWITNPPENVILLKGNHDLEFVYYIELMNEIKKKYFSRVSEITPRNTKTILDIADQTAEYAFSYFDYYGTIHELVKKHKVTLEMLNRWSNAIDQFPYTYKTHANDGREVIVVHAGYTEDEEILEGMSLEEFYIYAREAAYKKGGKKDSIIIAGHTPTIMPDEIVFNKGRIYKQYNASLNCTYYNIDCGAAYSRYQKLANLACLRLDDFKEFYVN